MLNLILILFVVFLVLGILLAALTLFIQGYLYSEPVGAIWWRAPAAAAALTLYLGVWVFADYRSVQRRTDAEGRYRPLFEFSARETETYEHLWIPGEGREVHYELRGNEYRSKSGRILARTARPLRITAAHQADGEKRVFEPEMEGGHFKESEKGQSLRYHDKDNRSRYMESGALGQISIFHTGWLAVWLLLNAGLVLSWFLSAWLLLRFQWSHALALAGVAFVAVSLFVLPMLLTQAERVRRERLPTPAAPTAGRPLTCSPGCA